MRDGRRPYEEGAALAPATAVAAAGADAAPVCAADDLRLSRLETAPHAWLGEMGMLETYDAAGLYELHGLLYSMPRSILGGRFRPRSGRGDPVDAATGPLASLLIPDRDTAGRPVRVRAMFCTFCTSRGNVIRSEGAVVGRCMTGEPPLVPAAAPALLPACLPSCCLAVP